MARERKVGVWVREEVITNSQERSDTLRRLLSDMIKLGGTTSHSARGETVAYILRGLERAGVPYTLTAMPQSSYAITVLPPDKRPPRPPFT